MSTPHTNTMTVEAGAILQNVQQAADEADRLFPLSLGSQGPARSAAISAPMPAAPGFCLWQYTRSGDGLEAVLPTGEIWNGLTRLRKDNTGYDLKDLFVGAEGTLGIVTKAVLKLFPKPRAAKWPMLRLGSPARSADLLNMAKASRGERPDGLRTHGSDRHGVHLYGNTEERDGSSLGENLLGTCCWKFHRVGLPKTHGYCSKGFWAKRWKMT